MEPGTFMHCSTLESVSVYCSSPSSSLSLIHIYLKKRGIKINIGSSYRRPEVLTMEVRGRNLVTGLPKTIVVTSEAVSYTHLDVYKRQGIYFARRAMDENGFGF